MATECSARWIPNCSRDTPKLGHNQQEVRIADPDQAESSFQLHAYPPTFAFEFVQGLKDYKRTCMVFPSPARETSATTVLRQIIGQAKKHPSLIPLFIFIGAGGTGAALYVLRLALFNPDVSWDRKNNPEPWNKLGPNDQYKFYSVNVDYSKLKKEGPDF
ncbi:cytochrome c oxidase subunit NDUFA4-like [Vulpes lagopus]|nr:cytochrome c oxidase subunit NDUFA4-like [Vulpes lagopus]